ncbi:MAG: sulfotransferase, partial [Chloroflexota bacterium]
MSKPPIFIVGVQRSGTTLLAALLAAHSRLSCGPETHFFRWLAQTEPDLLCAEEVWPETAVSFLNRINHTNYKGEGKRPLLAKYGLSESDVAAYLQNKRPSVAAVLAAVTEPYMHHVGKQRWVEKTPDHIEYLPLIRTHFPDSPIIYIVRDPRDVALSLMKVPWGATSLLEGLFY